MHHPWSGSDFGRRKKLKNAEGVEFRRATFTPFVLSVDGALGREANNLLKHVANMFSVKWELCRNHQLDKDKNYSFTIGHTCHWMMLKTFKKEHLLVVTRV